MPSIARTLRLSALPALLATLALLLAPTGAPARASHSRRGSCPTSSSAPGRRSRHARHSCPKRRSHGRKGASGPRGGARRKTSRGPAAPTVTLAPARCEDGSLPGPAGGTFSCGDGSEPSCEDGSSPARNAASGAPMCAVAIEPPEAVESCATEGGGECATVEWPCQEARASGASECHPGGAEEAEQESED